MKRQGVSNAALGLGPGEQDLIFGKKRSQALPNGFKENDIRVSTDRTH